MKTEPNTGQSLRASLSPPLDEAIVLVKEAFRKQGFGTLTEIDVRKTLEEKLGEQVEPYTILGMCNPHLASRAIKVEHEIGLLLPCNVLVHECGGLVHVVAQNPMQMMGMVGNETLTPIAEEAMDHIERAIQAIGITS